MAFSRRRCAFFERHNVGGKVLEADEQIFHAVKQVIIDTMVVDVLLQDEADTGVDWLLSAVQTQSRRNAALGPDAPNVRALGTMAAAGHPGEDAALYDTVRAVVPVHYAGVACDVEGIRDVLAERPDVCMGLPSAVARLARWVRAG